MQERKLVERKQRKARKLAESVAGVEAPNIDSGPKLDLTEIGTSGTNINGGVYREETNNALSGQKGADTFDLMRRRESQVAMLLQAMMNPLEGADWTFDIEDEEDATQQKMKTLCEWNFKDGLMEGWRQHLREVLTNIIFGYAVFETVHATEQVPALDGALTTYFKKFAFRKQNTIQRWLLEPKTGRLLGVVQQVVNDVNKLTPITIPGNFLVVFTNQKEGDNYEGISALRPMYGAYQRKDMYLKIAALGAENAARGVVVGSTPAGKTQKKDAAEFAMTLEAFANGEIGYMMAPAGYTVQIITPSFDPSKMVTLLNFENEEMARAVVAGFLMLGAGGGGGSYSLSSDISSFFLHILDSYAERICDVHNRQTVPFLCQANFGPQVKYPKLKCTGISDEAGAELATALSTLIGKQAIKPDDKLEDFLRKLYKLPAADPATAREQPTPAPFGGGSSDPTSTDGDAATEGASSDPANKEPPAPKAEDQAVKAGENFPEHGVQLAEGYKAQFNSSKAELKAAMSAGLRPMVDSLKKQISANWKGKSEATQITAGKGVSVPASLVAGYKNALKPIVAATANGAIARARTEVPSASKVKFGEYEDLPLSVKRFLDAQLSLLTDTQAADIEKIVLFQFTSSAGSQTDIDAVLKDIEDRVKPMLEATSNAGISLDAAAGDLTAQVVQNSRNSFFFAPDVLETIESFTFTNEDPISEICQNLTGQTFSADDPAAEQYYPPLHHNCKSRLVPNEKGEGKDITGIAIHAEDAEERNRLEKQITLCEHGHVR